MTLSHGTQGVLVIQREFHPSSLRTSPILTPRFRPGLINCFNSLEEWATFWNGTVVQPQIDIKYGFNDTVDYQYFESQVSVMEERLQAFKQVCLKGPSSQFLPYVGTTATVRDLVAIAEYFDGAGCDINYYGFSYGTTIGNYLINSKLPVAQLHTRIKPSPSSVPQSRWQDHFGRRRGPRHSRRSTFSPLLGPSC